MFIRLKITAAILAVVLINGLSFGQPLASGAWSKFSVQYEGIYRIDYTLLKKSGIDPGQIDPRHLQLFGNGNGMLPQANSSPRQNQLKEMAIFVSGEDDGKFDKSDFILFYGQGPDEFHFDVTSQSFRYTHNLYSDKNYFFLTVGASKGQRLQTSDNLPGNFVSVNEFNDFARYETEQYNVLKSGRSWYGEQLSSNNSITIQFQIPGIISNSPMQMVSRVMAQSYDEPSSFKVFFNDVQLIEHTVPAIANSRYARKGQEDADSATFTSTQVNASTQAAQNIRYQYTRANSTYSNGYLDNFIFSLKRALSWYDATTIFTSGSSVAQANSKFVINRLPNGAFVWDVTDPFVAKSQSYSWTDASSSFSTSTSSLKRFAYFVSDKAAAPVFESVVPNQNLSSYSSPDLLIISHPDFKSEAQRLATFRSINNNLSVLVVTPQEIYNEYSGGKQDITALRDFIKDLSSRGGAGLKNLLLFGRCSYDYKNRVPENTNYVPTYESRNSLDPVETYSSDDYFTFLESGEGDWSEDPAVNHSMDIGVGRISVTTAAQAKIFVDKLIEYENQEKRFGVWQTKISFVADDGDNSLHQRSANDLATIVENAHPDILTQKIYLDQFRQVNTSAGQRSPQTKEAIQRAIDDGSVIVNFTGHGSEHVWMDEQVLDDDMVLGFKNHDRYPIFVTATCEFGRHDDPFQMSNAERLLLQQNGGGISLVTTARPVQAVTNTFLNKSFYDQLFVKASGRYRDLGTIFRFTKNNSLSGVSNRNFSLLGDPSMHPALGEADIAFTKIKTSSGSDTLKALSKVIIEGEVQNGGVRVSSFSGEGTITMFDRPVPFTTKGDENPAFSYSQWSNAVFRGKASITSGSFHLELMLPQNIATTVAGGKITMFANSPYADASGGAIIKIGGIEPDVPADTEGPEITAYMGDTTFVDGGIASPNTTLLVHLRDQNGINSSSLNEDDRLLAVLDDSLSFDLGSHYTAELDNYRAGVIDFPLYSLQKGKHRIVVYASDTFGNRSSAMIEFTVTDANLVISSFYNYPNPFGQGHSTRVGFTHNRPGEDLEVELSIIDLAGLEHVHWTFSIPSSFTDVSLADWDGTTFAGNKLGSGVYVGKLSVRSLLDGSKNRLFTKLIIGN